MTTFACLFVCMFVHVSNMYVISNLHLSSNNTRNRINNKMLLETYQGPACKSRISDPSFRSLSAFDFISRTSGSLDPSVILILATKV